MLLTAIFNAASFSERAEEGSLSPAGHPHAEVPKFIDQLWYPKAVLDVKGLQAFGNMPYIS